MAAPRNALGRGLGALLPGSPDRLPQSSPGPALEVHESREVGFREIAVEQIDPNPEQPRRHFDAAHLEELVQSVKRHGVLQPVVVRRAGDRYELIVGERRWRASRAAGRETVPAGSDDHDVVGRLEFRPRGQQALGRIARTEAVFKEAERHQLPGIPQA